MSTYEFNKRVKSDSISLVSKYYKLTATRKEEYVYIEIERDQKSLYKPFKLKGLTSISNKVNDFELKVILLHFYKKAREFGKNMPNIQYVNYTSIFGSCYD